MKRINYSTNVIYITTALDNILFTCNLQNLQEVYEWLSLRYLYLEDCTAKQTDIPFSLWSFDALALWYTSDARGSKWPFRFSDMLCRPNPSRWNVRVGSVGLLKPMKISEILCSAAVVMKGGNIILSRYSFSTSTTNDSITENLSK